MSILIHLYWSFPLQRETYLPPSPQLSFKSSLLGALESNCYLHFFFFLSWTSENSEAKLPSDIVKDHKKIFCVGSLFLESHSLPTMGLNCSGRNQLHDHIRQFWINYKMLSIHVLAPFTYRFNIPTYAFPLRL